MHATPPPPEPSPRRLVVVGNGMVGHKLVDELIARAEAATGDDAPVHWHVTVLGEERRAAYDRVALSSVFADRTADDLALADPDRYAEAGVALHLGDPVAAIDREARNVHTASGACFGYDHLVLATGSAPFVPPVTGNDGPGTFVYRTLDDLDAIRAHAERADVRRGAVIGGGLLGLEAANALCSLGLETHVVEFAPRLMPVQLDEAGARALRRRIEALGVRVHLGRATTEIVGTDTGTVERLTFADDDHPDLEVDLVVFSAGIRPRDELARACGLEVGERGGIVVDGHLRTSDPAVSAIGECALVDGRIYGLVAPGYAMARALATQLATGTVPDADEGTEDTDTSRFTGADLDTKLKLLGVDVASIGDAHGSTEGARALVWDDPLHDRYAKLVVSADGDRVLGGILVGDATAYPTIVSLVRGNGALPEHPGTVLLPDLAAAGATGTATAGVAAMADDAVVCSCENVTKAAICGAVTVGCGSLSDVKATTRAGTGCGGCVPLVTDLVTDRLRAAGVAVSDALCEHFDLTRQGLFDLIRIRRYTSFAEVLAGHGRGGGCDICKPTVASILASLTDTYVLDGELASLQDTNDHFLANLQRDGTYSVVPRVPGGEITPEGLIAIGEVARDYDLYTKITGGQRIDLFGARVEQLPAIWERLIAAGFESGHAYGKALRTVKSCVGSTWCRYGVQDSTTMAIALELRYRGLRAPHKIKLAVSGCSRECAEAQSKDVGVIATERGWNLYVGGNGGQRPRHAVLFAEDLDDGALVRAIDRFLLYYVRTAGRLERTATWLEKIEGGVDHVRAVVFDDVLGIGGELDADMDRHVGAYECEWKATVDDPARRARFVSFVNAPDRPDPTVVFLRERGQIRPARPEERRSLVEVAP